MQRVAAQRLPSIYQFPEEAEEGGFVAYGPRVVYIFGELVSRQLVKLLRGADPPSISSDVSCCATGVCAASSLRGDLRLAAVSESVPG
jgi:hypothetical protein